MAQQKHFGVFVKDNQEMTAATPAQAVSLVWHGWTEKKAATAKPEDAPGAMSGAGDVAGDTTGGEPASRSNRNSK